MVMEDEGEVGGRRDSVTVMVTCSDGIGRWGTGECGGGDGVAEHEGEESVMVVVLADGGEESDGNNFTVIVWR